MKYLIAGFGSIGRRHFRNLRSLGEEDIIFYRTHQSTLQDEELHGFVVETDLQAALDHQPDAVIIANPTAYHLNVAIPAAQQGCHILLEKPVSHSLEKMELLKKTAEQSGSRILIGFQFRFHPGLKRIKDWLWSGEMGRSYFIRAHWGEYLPGWHPWEDYRESYSARKDLGGGVILTLSHPLDYLMWMLGEISAVSAIAGQQNNLQIEVEELVDIHVRFQNGTVGSVHLNYLQRPPVHSLEILTEQGMITWDYQSGDLNRYFHQEEDWKTYPLPDGYSRNDLFLAEMKHFINMISEKETPVCSLMEGIRTQVTISAIKESLTTNRMVKVKDVNI